MLAYKLFKSYNVSVFNFLKNIKYANAYKEVLVLFNYFLDEDDLLKIPSEQME